MRWKKPKILITNIAKATINMHQIYHMYFSVIIIIRNKIFFNNFNFKSKLWIFEEKLTQIEFVQIIINVLIKLEVKRLINNNNINNNYNLYIINLLHCTQGKVCQQPVSSNGLSAASLAKLRPFF